MGKFKLKPSFSVRERYKELSVPRSRSKTIMLRLSILFLAILTLYIFANSWTTKEVQSLEHTRVTKLDGYEVEKLAVLQDLENLLTVKTKEDYHKAKSTSNMIEWYKDEVFGSKYEQAKFYNAESVYAVDVQYSLKDAKGVTRYFILCNVTKGAETKTVRFLIETFNGEIIGIMGI